MVQVSQFAQTAFLGLVTVGTSGVRDFVCHNCGAGAVIHPVRYLNFLLAASFSGLLVLGIFLGCTGICTGDVGLVLFGGGMAAVGGGVAGMAVLPDLQRWRRPVVPGAAVPPFRFRTAHSARRCSCGAEAPCTAVTTQSTNGVYTGMEFGHTCSGCGKAFTIDSPISTLLSILGGVLFLLPLAVFMYPSAAKDWTDYVPTVFLGGLGLGSLWLGAWRLWSRLRYPLLPPRPEW